MGIFAGLSYLLFIVAVNPAAFAAREELQDFLLCEARCMQSGWRCSENEPFACICPNGFIQVGGGCVREREQWKSDKDGFKDDVNVIRNVLKTGSHKGHLQSEDEITDNFKVPIGHNGYTLVSHGDSSKPQTVKLREMLIAAGILPLKSEGVNVVAPHGVEKSGLNFKEGLSNEEKTKEPEESKQGMIEPVNDVQHLPRVAVEEETAEEDSAHYEVDKEVAQDETAEAEKIQQDADEQQNSNLPQVDKEVEKQVNDNKQQVEVEINDGIKEDSMANTDNEHESKQKTLQTGVEFKPKPAAIVNGDDWGTPARLFFPAKDMSKSSMADVYFLAIIAVCSVAGFVGLVAAGVCWYQINKAAKSMKETDYPAYGVTGPARGEKAGSPGDRKLAQSAQMYHYQHQKQQMLAMERANSELHGNGSEDSSEEEDEEGDFTVYECPGPASAAGEMEVRNPMYMIDPPPPRPANLEPGKNDNP